MSDVNEVSIDFDDIDKTVDEVVQITDKEIETLVKSFISCRKLKGKPDPTEEELYFLIENYKKDLFRVFLWRCTIKNLLQVNISENGEEIDFFPA